MQHFTAFLERLRKNASHACVEEGDSSYTYAELLDELQRWTSLLETWNVLPGSVVGVRADYSLSAIGALLAVVSRPAVAALIPRGPSPVATDYLKDAHAAGLIEIDANARHNWHTVTQSAHHPLLERLRTTREGGIVIFTSGTTGTPRAALHSIESFLRKFCRASRLLRTLAFLQFDHVAGLDTLLYTLAAGGTLILTRRRDPSEVAQIIEAHGVEVLPTSPSFLRMLCRSGYVNRYDLRSLKVITYGSEPMDPTTLTQLNVQFPGVRICQKYGTTELGSPRTVSRGNDSLWLKIESEVESKVIDGVLWMRSESAFLGYLNAPSLATDDGWYCTGDVVEVEGVWVRILGRASDLINVGGEKVAPVEIEEVILNLDFVRDVTVFAQPHPLLGQIVGARVVVTEEELDRREISKAIRAHCRKHLGAFKVPVRIDVLTAPLFNRRHKKGPASF